MHTHAKKRLELKQKLLSKKMLIAPGIFDLISAKIADRMGFDLLYMTGYGTVASYLGLPDAGLATYTDMLNRASAFAAATHTPIIADADTGYGGLLNVAHTVKGYESAGLAGIQLEDQEFPKKCGHTPGRRVIPMPEMVKKIEVAKEAREDPNFLIVARTDARTTLGLDEALIRAQAYYSAGADILFVESPESVEEMETITSTLKAPTLINNVEGGRTPVLGRKQLEQMGFKLSIYPATGFLAAGKALQTVYESLADNAEPIDNNNLYSFAEFNKLLGFEDVWAFESKHS